MTKKNNLKGFAGPRSKSFADAGGPIELPDLEPEEIEPDDSEPAAPSDSDQELVDYRTTHRGVVDQRRPRRLKCQRCYGQGVVPSARHCGAGKTCPTCQGSGKIEPAPIKRPETPIGPGSTQAASKADALRSYDRDYKPRPADPTAQELLPGDVDFDPADSTGYGRASERGELPGKLTSRKKKKPAKRKKPKSDVPPWERSPPRSTAQKIAEAKAEAENNRAPWD